MCATRFTVCHTVLNASLCTNFVVTVFTSESAAPCSGGTNTCAARGGSTGSSTDLRSIRPWNCASTAAITVFCTPGLLANGSTVCTYRSVFSNRFRPHTTTGVNTKQITLNTKMMLIPADRAIPPTRAPADRRGGDSAAAGAPPPAGRPYDFWGGRLIGHRVTNTIPTAQTRQTLPSPNGRSTIKSGTAITQPIPRGRPGSPVRPTTTVGGGPSAVHHRYG